MPPASSRTAPARRRTRGAQHPPRPRPASLARAQRAGGPQDRALYPCPCGLAFTAEVSTDAACPRCGAEQDW